MRNFDRIVKPLLFPFMQNIVQQKIKHALSVIHFGRLLTRILGGNTEGVESVRRRANSPRRVD